MPTRYQGTAEERQALDAFIKFQRASNVVEHRLFSRGTLGPLTPTQFAVLEALYHLGPMCQGTLSGKLLRSTGNMTLVIDNLEKQGFVKRVRSVEDRRMINIELTPSGSEILEQVLPEQVKAIVEEMGVLTAEEQAQLAKLCRKLGLRETR